MSKENKDVLDMREETEIALYDMNDVICLIEEKRKAIISLYKNPVEVVKKLTGFYAAALSTVKLDMEGQFYLNLKEDVAKEYIESVNNFSDLLIERSRIEVMKEVKNERDSKK